MEKQKQLEKLIVEYYNCLYRIDDKFQNLFKTSERPLNSLKNQIEQLRLVSSVDSLDKENFSVINEDFRAKLIFKINVAIEDEISLVSDINSQLNNANQGLKNKLQKFEAARSKVDLSKPEMQELIIGTPNRPRLNLLLEWAIESSNYYNELYFSINKCVRNLDFKKEETLNDLVKSMTEEKSKRAKIDRILAFTQFIVTKEN